MISGSQPQKHRKNLQCLLASAFFLVTIFLVNSAGHAENAPQSQLSIDTGGFPTLVIEADNVRVVDVLKQLGEKLRFDIEHLPEDNTQTVTGIVKGELNQLLQSDMLGRLSFVLLHQDNGVDRLIIVSPPATNDTGLKSGSTAAESKPAATPPALPQRASASGGPAAPDGVRRSAGPSGQLNRLLRAQAIHGSGAANGTAPTSPGNASPGSGADTTAQASLSAMARAAQVNVQTLVGALRAVCIGPNCPAQ